MKNLLLISFCFFGSVLLLKSQSIQPALINDELITPIISVPPANTSIAISPAEKSEDAFTAIAFDNNASNEYEIQWYFQNNPLQTTFSRTNASDPDVEFADNSEFTYLIYTVPTLDEVFIDRFLYSFPPYAPVDGYYLVGNQKVSKGYYPNIDMNGNQDGAVCYAYTNTIGLNTYDASGTLGPQFIIPEPTIKQPDIAVDYNGDFVYLTFIAHDMLIISILDYTDLTNGVYTIIGQFSYLPEGSPYQFPRIAASRHRNYLPAHHFTVVAERITPNGTQIEGFFFQNGSMTQEQLILNDGLEFCENQKPVVTYNMDKVITAWSSDHQSCPGVNPPNGSYTDAIMKEFYADGTTVNNDYFEINQQQGAFNQANISVTSRKDGSSSELPLPSSFPVSSSDPSAQLASEAVTYSDNSDLYFKSRLGQLPSYRKKSPIKELSSEAKETAFSIYPNPSNGFFTISTGLINNQEEVNSDNPLIATIYNPLGKKIHEIKIKNDMEQFDISSLPKGIYLIEVQINGERYSEKIIYQ